MIGKTRVFLTRMTTSLFLFGFLQVQILQAFSLFELYDKSDPLKKTVIKFHNKIKASVHKENSESFKETIHKLSRDFSKEVSETLDHEMPLSMDTGTWVHALWIHALTNPYDSFEGAYETVLFDLLYKRDVEAPEAKLQELISYGLLFNPHSGNFFFDTMSRVNTDLLLSCLLSKNKKRLSNAFLLKIIDPENLKIDSFLDGQFDGSEMNQFLLRSHLQIVNHSIEQRDLRSLFQIVKMVVKTNIPLIIEEKDELSQFYFRIPLLDEIIKSMLGIRAKIAKDTDSHFLSDVLEYYFDGTPFRLKSIDKIYDVAESASYSFSDKEQKLIDDYIRLGVVRDYLLKTVGSRIFIETGAPTWQLLGFIKYIKSWDLFFEELSAYNGIFKLMPPEVLLKKWIADGKFLDIQLYFSLFKPVDFLKPDAAKRNYFHWLLDESLNLTDGVRLSLLRLFLYSPKVPQERNLFFMKATDSKGETPIDFASKFSNQEFKNLLENYLKEHRAFTSGRDR